MAFGRQSLNQHAGNGCIRTELFGIVHNGLKGPGHGLAAVRPHDDPAGIGFVDNLGRHNFHHHGIPYPISGIPGFSRAGGQHRGQHV